MDAFQMTCPSAQDTWDFGKTHICGQCREFGLRFTGLTDSMPVLIAVFGFSLLKNHQSLGKMMQGIFKCALLGEKSKFGV